VSSAGGVLVATDAQTATLAVTDSNHLSSASTGGAGVSLTVQPAATSQLSITAPSTATAGVAFTITVTAQDAFGNTTPAYRGTVHFSSSDTRAVLPKDYAFIAADSGMHTFTNGVTLNKTGTQTLTVWDKANKAIQGSVSISVGSAPAVATAALAARSGPTTSGSVLPVLVPASGEVGGIDPPPRNPPVQPGATFASGLIDPGLWQRVAPAPVSPAVAHVTADAVPDRLVAELDGSLLPDPFADLQAVAQVR
jgi:hypothetical protein